jgi:hypothetical protein
MFSAVEKVKPVDGQLSRNIEVALQCTSSEQGLEIIANTRKIDAQ